TGALELVEHDGEDDLAFDERPSSTSARSSSVSDHAHADLMPDRAHVDLGAVDARAASAAGAAMK
ncbi:MAG: hypothetical protein KIS78_28370, partial [Labilithrix sp.]|nr:hypothetical protein [Labilithrix sp.]